MMERGWAGEERAGGQAWSTPVSTMVQDEEPARKRGRSAGDGRGTGLMASGWPMEKCPRRRAWAFVLRC